ncbi:MAG TPA: response regulator transcription factor [Ramlibacter sp.]|nr:response regulator transcription factor [Ramlibacter sp.]
MQAIVLSAPALANSATWRVLTKVKPGAGRAEHDANTMEMQRVTIDVLVADDQPMIRFGIKALLASTHDFVVAREATTAHETLHHVRDRDWGLVLLDLALPGCCGPDLIKLLKEERPRLPILVFTGHQEELFALRTIRAGALGYLSRRAPLDALLDAMRRVAGGAVCVSQRVTEMLAADLSRRTGHPPHSLLTNRELGIFHRIVRGHRLTQIADELSLSVKTVSTHKSNILGKMTLNGQADLVRYAIEHKLVDTAAE